MLSTEPAPSGSWRFTVYQIWQLVYTGPERDLEIWEWVWKRLPEFGRRLWPREVLTGKRNTNERRS